MMKENLKQYQNAKSGSFFDNWPKTLISLISQVSEISV